MFLKIILKNLLKGHTGSRLPFQIKAKKKIISGDNF
jgi:hypothetical protein